MTDMDVGAAVCSGAVSTGSAGATPATTPPLNLFTRDGWSELGERLATDASDFFLRLFMALIVLILGWIVIMIVTRLFRILLNRRSENPTLVIFMMRSIGALLKLVLIIACISMLGIASLSLAALFAAFAVAFGLAASGFLGNFFAGAFLVIYQPLRVGQYVAVDGVEGTVLYIDTFNTTIRTPEFCHILIPNTVLATTCISNHEREPIRRMDNDFMIAYAEEIAFARQVILLVASRDTRILTEPKTVVRVLSMTEKDSGVVLSSRPWCKVEDMWDVMWDFREAVKNEFDRVGIRLQIPQHEVHAYQMVGEKSRPEIDAEYRAQLEKLTEQVATSATTHENFPSNGLFGWRWMKRVLHEKSQRGAEKSIDKLKRSQRRSRRGEGGGVNGERSHVAKSPSSSQQLMSAAAGAPLDKSAQAIVLRQLEEGRDVHADFDEVNGDGSTNMRESATKRHQRKQQ